MGDGLAEERGKGSGKALIADGSGRWGQGKGGQGGGVEKRN